MGRNPLITSSDEVYQCLTTLISEVQWQRGGKLTEKKPLPHKKSPLRTCMPCVSRRDHHLFVPISFDDNCNPLDTCVERQYYQQEI